jgi:hypothetical protein
VNLILAEEDRITAYERTRPSWFPRVARP